MNPPNLSFGFLDVNTVLVASIQGIKKPDGNMIEVNKRLTKSTFGLRPANLLVACLQALCAAWDIHQLLGIDPNYQVKRRINATHQGFKFDYIDFWKSLGASRNNQWYWQLPISVPHKDLSQVPTNKRSQYRKRNELLKTTCEYLARDGFFI